MEKQKSTSDSTASAGSAGSTTGATKKASESTESRKSAGSTSADSSASEGSPMNWISELTSRSGDFEKRLETLVRSRPILFLAGAVALGYVANRLLTGAETSPRRERA